MLSVKKEEPVVESSEASIHSDDNHGDDEDDENEDEVSMHDILRSQLFTNCNLNMLFHCVIQH